MTFLFWNGNQNAKKKWKFEINVREHRRGNQKRTIQRNWQHRVHKTKKNKTSVYYRIFKRISFVLRRLNILCIKFKIIGGLYNNTVHPDVFY